MVEIIWTKKARNDLKSIHKYIAKDSLYYADKYISRLSKRVDQLQNHPNAGRVVPEFSSLNIREVIEGNYRIIYRLVEDNIYVTNVHHGAKILRSN